VCVMSVLCVCDECPVCVSGVCNVKSVSEYNWSRSTNECLIDISSTYNFFFYI